MAQIKILSVKKLYRRDFTKFKKFRKIPERAIKIGKKTVCFYQEVLAEVVGGDDNGKRLIIDTPIKSELDTKKQILSLWQFKEGDVVEIDNN